MLLFVENLIKEQAPAPYLIIAIIQHLLNMSIYRFHCGILALGMRCNFLHFTNKFKDINMHTCSIWNSRESSLLNLYIILYCNTSQPNAPSVKKWIWHTCKTVAFQMMGLTPKNDQRAGGQGANFPIKRFHCVREDKSACVVICIPNHNGDVFFSSPVQSLKESFVTACTWGISAKLLARINLTIDNSFPLARHKKQPLSLEFE